MTAAELAAFMVPAIPMSCLPVIAMLAVTMTAWCQHGQWVADDEAFRNELLVTYRKLKASPEERGRVSALKSLPFFPLE